MEMESMPIMNNKRLEKFSEKFTTDDGSEVEKKCFFLFAGQDLNEGRAFNLDLTQTQNDDPNISKNISVDITIDNSTVEQCSDVIVSLTKIVPDYAIYFRYDDLFPKPAGMDLERRVRLQAPLFYLRNQVVKHSPYSDQAVSKFIDLLVEEKLKKALGGFNQK